MLFFSSQIDPSEGVTTPQAEAEAQGEDPAQ